MKNELDIRIESWMKHIVRGEETDDFDLDSNIKHICKLSIVIYWKEKIYFIEDIIYIWI